MLKHPFRWLFCLSRPKLRGRLIWLTPPWASKEVCSLFVLVQTVSSAVLAIRMSLLAATSCSSTSIHEPHSPSFFGSRFALCLAGCTHVFRFCLETSVCSLYLDSLLDPLTLQVTRLLPWSPWSPMWFCPLHIAWFRKPSNLRETAVPAVETGAED